MGLYIREYYDYSGYRIGTARLGASSRSAQPRSGPVRQPPRPMLPEGWSWSPLPVVPAYVVQASKRSREAQKPRRPPEPRRGWRERARDAFASFLLGADRVLSWPYRKSLELTARAVGYAEERVAREKAEGDKLEAFGWALAASTASFVGGVAAGISGLFAPAAWVDAGVALSRPRQTVSGIIRDPASWSFLVGSLVGGKALGRVVAAGRARVVEPDLSAVRRGSLDVMGRVSRGSGGIEYDWVAKIELEGDVRPVGPRGVKPASRGRFVLRDGGNFLVEERGTVRVRKILRAQRVRRAFRYDVGGKELLGVEEWVVRGGRFRFRGYYKDPVMVESVQRLESPASSLRSIIRPPRVEIVPVEFEVGGAVVGGLLGLGSRVRESRSTRGSGSSLTSEVRAGAGGRSVGSRKSMVRELVGPSTSGSSLTSVSQAPGSASRSVAGSGSPGSLLGVSEGRARRVRGGSGSSGGRRRRGRRRRYGEIVYPHAWFPL